MAKEKKVLHIQAKIRKISFKGFSTTPLAEALEEQLSPDDYIFSFEGETSGNRKEKTLDVSLKITAYNKEEQELCYIKTLNTFFIENFEELIRDGDKDFEINTGLLQMTAGVALGTTRGMFAMSVANTNLSNAIIPIIDAANLIPNGVQKKEEE